MLTFCLPFVWLGSIMDMCVIIMHTIATKISQTLAYASGTHRFVCDCEDKLGFCCYFNLRFVVVKTFSSMSSSCFVQRSTMKVLNTMEQMV